MILRFQPRELHIIEPGRNSKLQRTKKPEAKSADLSSG